MATEMISLNSSEWKIMEKLWEESPRTMTQLLHLLKEEVGWSKSTVNTLLARMLEKDIIGFDEGTKAKLYYPKIQRDDAALAETTSLLDRVYKGSVSLMMNTLVKKQALSDEDIRKLQELLDQAKRDQ
ncbi:MAG: BlaI/MecI/CopY family transcriptional regulator [Lachnospiraceae bacterium]